MAPFEQIRTKLEEERQRFLDADLEMCFTLADLAETRRRIGSHELALMSLRDAEDGYTVVSRFLADPKHTAFMTLDRTQDLNAKLARLRKRLDILGSSG
jgi:hypothetical protein